MDTKAYLDLVIPYPCKWFCFMVMKNTMSWIDTSHSSLLRENKLLKIVAEFI